MRPEVTDAIIDAVLDELAEKGYGRLSMDNVARRAGVGKSALYRRWSSKQDMTVDIVSQLSVPLADVPDAGSLRDEIQNVFASVRRWLEDPRLGRIMPDLVAEAKRNDTLADAMATQVEAPRRTRGKAMVDRAIARRELPHDVDRELLLDLLAAPIFWRISVRRKTVAPDYLESLTDAVLVMLTAPTAPAIPRLTVSES